MLDCSSRPGAAAARAALLDFTTRLGKLETQRAKNHQWKDSESACP